MSKSNPYSHLTAKERKYISFPCKILLDKNLIVGKTLDFGCGFGKDVEVLKMKGYDVSGYDPHYFPINLEDDYDTIICFYVLNVLESEEQINVLMDISERLKIGGKAYFAVRRDVKYQGFRTHKLHQIQTFQTNVKLPFKSVFVNDFCEIYEFQHYTYLHQGNEAISPFLSIDEKREPIVETATVFSFYDKFPVSKGHALIVPKRVVSDYFELTNREQIACWLVVNRVKEILQQKFNPDGFNIGINVGETAGQTIPHVHIHIIPRYKEDVPNPRGGIRGVIPSKKEY